MTGDINIPHLDLGDETQRQVVVDRDPQQYLGHVTTVLLEDGRRIHGGIVFGDCGYPGLELLPDGTLVTTTYGHWSENDPPYIVSVRLTLAEMDARLPASA